jgi:PAS domain-containing protein
MSWFGFGGRESRDEAAELKEEVSQLQREREELQERCREFEAQLNRVAGEQQSPLRPQPQRATPPAGTGMVNGNFGSEMRHFISNAQISIFGIDKDFKVNVWNSRVEELMGRKASDVMGKTLYEVLAHSNDTPVETRNEVTLLAYRCAPLCECIGTLS